MQSGHLCNLGPVETGLHNRKRLVDWSAPACEFLCLKCLHLKSKNYYIHKYSTSIKFTSLVLNRLPSQQLNFPTVTGFSRLWGRGALRPPTPPIIYVPGALGTKKLKIVNLVVSWQFYRLFSCCKFKADRQI